MTRMLFAAALALSLCGCEVVAKFYVDQSIVSQPGFSPEHPDTKAHAEIAVKLYESK